MDNKSLTINSESSSHRQTILCHRAYIAEVLNGSKRLKKSQDKWRYENEKADLDLIGLAVMGKPGSEHGNGFTWRYSTEPCRGNHLVEDGARAGFIIGANPFRNWLTFEKRRSC